MTHFCCWMVNVKCLTQGVTRFILPGADVQPRQQYCMVVPLAIFTYEAWLPLAEAVEGLVCVVVDRQAQLTAVKAREVKCSEGWWERDKRVMNDQASVMKEMEKDWDSLKKMKILHIKFTLIESKLWMEEMSFCWVAGLHSKTTYQYSPIYAQITFVSLF